MSGVDWVLHHGVDTYTIFDSTNPSLLSTPPSVRLIESRIHLHRSIHTHPVCIIIDSL
mgnify:CR=1